MLKCYILSIYPFLDGIFYVLTQLKMRYIIYS